jgi:lysophospholipase L1-like esterase
MNRVLLVGDSIRLHYQPHVRTALSGQAEVTGPRENCGSSRTVRACLGQWIKSCSAGLIHINCGLHDIRVDEPAPGVQVPLDEYAQNVEAIVRHARDHVEQVIWATSTPINEGLHQINKVSRRSEADLSAYNRVAVEIARAAGAQINDLWQFVTAHGAGPIWEQDGVHFNDEGYMLIGAFVADKIRECIPQRG